MKHTYRAIRDNRRLPRYGRATLVLAAGLALLAGPWCPPARAQQSSAADQVADEDLAPWEVGTTSAQRRRARALMAEGNRLIRMPLFARAAAKYREALTYWDHPALHYNLAVAQLNLAQLIEAHRSFERALRFGPAAVHQDKYDQARAYLKILEQRLGRIEVVCAVPGAEVMLDGERLFVGPGRRETLVSPGRHQLVAGKTEHVPDTRQVAVSSGERVRHVLAPRSVDQVARRERRWPVWKPWAAVAAGAGLIAGAGYLDWASSRGFERFDRGFEAIGCVQYGCQRHELGALAAHRDAATRQQQAALVLYAAGGVAVAAGAALIYFNREHLVQRRAERRVSVGATLAPDHAGVGMTFSF